MNFVLLTGAGFSRNWGGWLAPEVFEYLIGCPQLTAPIRNLLWRYRRAGGFEDALAQLQEDFLKSQNRDTEERVRKMQDAISQMFADMDKAFGLTMFEPQSEMPYLVRSFLVRFDAIFTLNQDLLMERHYLDDNISLSSYRKWNSWHIPGMNPSKRPGTVEPAAIAWSPLDPTQFKAVSNSQPYFKLHGSSNWMDASGKQLLIMGGNKTSSIAQHPILKWQLDRFKDYLSREDTRLMVIGYSFADDHANQTIGEAADKGRLRLFIVDPLGVDVMDKNRNAQIYAPDALFTRLHPHVIGASRRGLREIFGSDRVEHAKVMRFFSP